jgi:preprotein translocase subunit SecG
MKKETWIKIGIVSAVVIIGIVIINKNKESAKFGGKTQEEFDAEEIKKLVDAIDKAKK